MINGEGTRPNTSDVTSPDPYDEISSWLDRKMDADDASDALSVYSSCDGSEFERYCSANSVMGTASLCSSIGTCNDFLDSDFGSSRSLRFGRSFGGAKIEFQKEDIEGANGIPGEEGGAKWRITNWTKSIPSSDGVESRHDSSTTLKGSNGNGFEFRQRFDVSTGEGSTSTTDRRRDDLLPTRAEKNKSQVDDAGNERSEFHSLLKSSGSHLCKATFEDMLIEQENGLFSGFDELESEAYDAYDRRRGSEGVVEAQDHSDDDDDSVLSYGTDDERRTKLHYRQELKSKNENPLLINSSVAFGSDDWDEFIQESEQNSLASAMLAKPEEKKQQCHGTDRTFVSSSFATSIVVPNRFGSGKEPIVGDMPEPTHKVNGSDKLKQDPEDSFAQKDRLSQEVKEKRGLTTITGAAGNPKGVGDDDVSGSILLQKLKLQLDPLSDIAVSHLSSPVIEEPQGKEAVILGSHEVNVLPSTDEKKFNIHLKTTGAHAPALGELVKKTLPPIKVEKLDSNECYDEVVLEMEEILLDSTESHGARFPQSSRASLPQLRQPFRDGSGTASTSGTDDPYPLIQQSSKVDWVEVIGAKQKKGDVSFGERIVGVKEYTVYSLRVWSGKDQWEVERRYRDFFTLFRQLKNLFADHGQALPSPWSRVEQESRKIFGNASPGVVSQRSALIQECLRSILHSGVPHSTQSVLICFLSPQKVASSSSMSNAPRSGSAFTAETSTEDVSFLGKTISLLVETQPRKPVKQLLEAQHYSCAGCHKRLDAEKTLVLEFVQTLGWGKPRLCEYTGQLFCASCHTNETAVLPAKVLHFWDFTEYPVSQLAKSYLESIYDQPMLCVSAVNPFLFAKVPSLLRVMGFRKKIGAMMPYLRCPFRRSIQRGVGSRRYLLESTEFFALRDLVDLSKGAFSALPVMVETIFKKILEHITQRCLVCCDVGIPCCARQACEDPSSLIFPFQEDEIKRCSSCQSVFHKPCFKKLSNCPCGANIELRDSATSTNLVKGMSSNEFDAVLENSVGKPAPGSSAGFLSSLFSNAKQEVWGSKKGNPVILMGPLPNTFSDPL